MRIAIITGASSGMGREMAKEIDRQFQGIDEIWLVARRRERLDEVASHIEKEVRKYSLDLTCEHSMKVLQNELEYRRPDVKILVNAAGFGRIGRVGVHTLDSEMGMVALNCETLVGITHMVLPYMKATSRIIQFASAAAFLPQPGFAVYAATKSFVLSYSRALQAELRRKQIYVTSVCPGPVETEFFEVAASGASISWMKKLVMAKPQSVVRKALLDSRKGKGISVYGVWMKVVHVLSKILPHEWILRIMEKLV